MTTSRAPLPLARAAVEIAVRRLPSTARARYRSELVADLHHLRPVAQLGYLAVVICLLPALRAALQEDAMPDPTARVPLWRCRILRWHEFVRRSTPDGGRYQQCARCGVDRGPAGYGPLTTPPWPVGSAGA